MKCKFIILAILLCCLFVAGCESKNTDSQIDFYYCNSRTNYASESSIIGSEKRQMPSDHLAYIEMLNDYLSGPNSHTLSSPFPVGTALYSLNIEQQTAFVTLNSTFAELTGIDLTVACACLSLTTQEITGCATVTISAHNALLDNMQSITIDNNTMQLTDQVHP